MVLVGLASKNAILIVEFAKHKRESGLPRRDATLAAVKLRLRPILMTSFAFILGVVPLMIAVGAGAEMRRSLGMAVFSGMLGVTLFGIFLTPVFFYVIEGAAEQPAVRLAGAYTWEAASRAGSPAAADGSAGCGAGRRTFVRRLPTGTRPTAPVKVVHVNGNGAAGKRATATPRPTAARTPRTTTPTAFCRK